MPVDQPHTSAVDADDVPGAWRDILERIAQAGVRLVVEEDGRPVAAIISPAELERLVRLDARRSERFKVIDEMRAAFKDIDPEEIEREVARALAEGRQERGHRVDPR